MHAPVGVHYETELGNRLDEAFAVIGAGDAVDSGLHVGEQRLQQRSGTAIAKGVQQLARSTIIVFTSVAYNLKRLRTLAQLRPQCGN